VLIDCDQLEKGQAAATHTSQSPITIQTTLPCSTKAESAKYRSENDPTLSQRPKILVTDTPGHGKLRSHAFDLLRTPPPNLGGVIFVVDATSLSSDTPGRSAPGLMDAAEFLHDALLELQKRYTRAKSSKGPGEVQVLIAANKMDLFIALPTHLVKSALEAEITKIRSTRARGLVDSGAKLDSGEEEDWLGDGGEGKFDFTQMEGLGITVQIRGGSVTGDGGDIDDWWSWIGEQL
jgi:signal recognition particle receptor subunit beta